MDKKLRKVFTVNFIEKKIRHLFGKFEKNNFCHKKKEVQGGGIPTIFLGKSNMALRWVLNQGC